MTMNKISVSSSKHKAKLSHKITWGAKKHRMQKTRILQNEEPENMIIPVTSTESVTETTRGTCSAESQKETNMGTQSCGVSASAMDRALEFKANLPPEDPTFVRLMLKSHISSGYWLGLDKKTCNSYMPANDATIVLVDENDTEYGTNYLSPASHDKGSLSGGWKKFAKCKGLQEKDVVIFQRVEPHKFKVYIIVSNSTGSTSGLKMQENNPIWAKKSKALARKSIHSEKKSANKAKNYSSADSLFSRKTNDFNAKLPRLGKYRNCGDARSRVRDVLMYFHCICRKLLHTEEALESKSNNSGEKITRVDLAASNTIKKEGKCVNTERPILGEVPGVEVGDEFRYRAELAVIGMHRHYQAGIDSMELDGIPVANSIVTSGSYNDDTEHAHALIYSGQGGNNVGNSKNYEDQKLEKGNLALSNSKIKGTPVRVVRGWSETVKGKPVTIYYYDGLYTVKRYWRETGSHGKLVYKFELTRNPGQPEVAWKELKKASKSKVRQGVCIRDVSHGKEHFPVSAVNVLDDKKPPEFTYVSKMVYPDWYRPSPPVGCNCVGRCTDSKICGCAIRNGGNIPYNHNGAIVEEKQTVYECGPHCTCPPTCYNRVTQRGIKVRLEIFKTKTRGWGLRALTSIPPGTFICEYTGELLEEKEAEKRTGNDEYLFDIGWNCVDSSIKDTEFAEEEGYTIDACQFGNLGRFINHSCSPNLYAQNVIYDHNDVKMPHVMLFAGENIPAFKELTFHYNYQLGQVLDSNGKAKSKKCFCGSADCSGRMY